MSSFSVTISRHIFGGSWFWFCYNRGLKKRGKNISDTIITCTTDWRQHRQLGWRRQRARAVLGSVNVPEMKNDHGDRSLQHSIITTHGNDHFTTITFRAATGVLLNIDHTLTEWPNINQFYFFSTVLASSKKIFANSIERKTPGILQSIVI